MKPGFRNEMKILDVGKLPLSYKILYTAIRQKLGIYNNPGIYMCVCVCVHAWIYVAQCLCNLSGS